MDGHLTLDSIPGRGTIFRATIPLVSVMLPAASATGASSSALGVMSGAAAPRLSGRVLIAEDNIVNQRVVATMVRKRGLQVSVVDDGRAAVDAFAAGRFDLLLMDVQMPGMDGLEATAAIRTIEGGSGARVPIVALTAHALAEDRERCLAAGMDAFLTKPLARRN